MKKPGFRLIGFFASFLLVIFTNLIDKLNFDITVLAQEYANPIPKPEIINSIPLLTNREVYLTTAVLIFSLIVIFLNFLLLWKVPDVITPENLLVNFTITLIVVGTLYLITAGFSGEDIAPALGLFGTLVGYLLGKKSVLNNKDRREKHEDRKEEKQGKND